MLRHNVEGTEEAAVTKSCTKIRKRCALSSSGASNPLRKLRFRRGVLLRRKGSGGVSPCSSRNMSESSRNQHSSDRLTDEMRSSVSARKLVNALWQLNNDQLFEEEIGREVITHRSLVPRSSLSMEMPKKSRTRSKMLEADGERSWHNGHGQWFSDTMSNGSTMEYAIPTCPKERAICLQDLYTSLIASRKLVKVLARIWGPGELNPSTMSLLSTLRSELNIAYVHVRQLIKEQNHDGNEVEGLKKQLVEEMESWKSKQKEKMAATLQFAVSELDSEKRSRKRAERINKKLGTVLANTQASLEITTKEVEREKKSRERVETICNELIRGIGDDKAEVEELRRQNEKAQEELEKEREMLQLADEWREERVQMKLSEARFQFEEKHAVIDQLRNKLEAFLETKEKKPTSEPCANDQMQLSHALEGGGDTAGMTVNKTGEEEGEGEGEGEIDDSEGSDMHSIELNMDDNSKSYSWSYTPSSKHRRNTSNHNSFSDRGMEGDNLCGFDRKFEETDEELEGEWDEGCSSATLNFDQDAERYQAIKNLRDQMLAGSAFILSQDRSNAEREYCGL